MWSEGILTRPGGDRPRFRRLPKSRRFNQSTDSSVAPGRRQASKKLGRLRSEIPTRLSLRQLFRIPSFTPGYDYAQVLEARSLHKEPTIQSGPEGLSLSWTILTSDRHRVLPMLKHQRIAPISTPTARMGSKITVPITFRVPLKTAAPPPESSVVVVVSFSIVTGSPVRESCCTERVVTVFCVEHAVARFMIRNKVGKQV